MDQRMAKGPGDREVEVRKILTAYGEPIDLEIHDGVPSMTLDEIVAYCGIWDPAARRLCRMALKAGINASIGPGVTGAGWRTVYKIIRKHGGGRPPVVGLPLPSRRFALELPPVGGMENAGWNARHHILLEFLGATWRAGTIGRDPDDLVGILTAQLETWTEGRLRTLPQAVGYALSAHPEWRRKAITWLLPFRDTWLRDYRARAPWIGSLARTAGKSVDGIPSWLGARS